MLKPAVSVFGLALLTIETVGDDPTSVAIAPNGHYAYVTDGSDSASGVSVVEYFRSIRGFKHEVTEGMTIHKDHKQTSSLGPFNLSSLCAFAALREIFCFGWAMRLCGVPFIFESFVPFRGFSFFQCSWRFAAGKTTGALESDCRRRGGLRRRDAFEPQRSCV